jgi:hypothetical protein
MGIYDLGSISTVLSLLTPGTFPASFPAGYEILEGETAVNSRIHLGGMGVRADGKDQTMMNDGTDKATFEDIDGLE